MHVGTAIPFCGLVEGGRGGMDVIYIDHIHVMVSGYLPGRWRLLSHVIKSVW